MKFKDMLKKVWLWLLKSGWQYLNIFALIAIYVINKGNVGIEVVTGLWIFLLIAMNGWKLFTKSHV
jgi:hypothetical protein